MPRTAARREMFKPRGTTVSNAPFEGTTTFQDDFPGWKNAERAKPFVPQRNANINPEDRDFHTESALRFDDKGYAKRKDFKPPATLGNSLPFDGKTTAMQDYVPWGAQRTASFKPKLDANPVAENRDFKTEAGASFVDKGYVAERHKPQQRAVGPPQPFEGVTTTNADYVPWKVGATESFKPKNRAVTIPENRDFQSESSSQFNPKYQPRREGFNPRGAFLAQPDDRDFNTESRSNLRDQGFQKRPTFKPNQTALEQQPFNGDTTHAHDFVQHPLAMRQSMKPQDRGMRGAEDRDFLTETGGRYTAHPRHACESFKCPKRTQKTKVGHNEYQRTANGEYIPLF